MSITKSLTSGLTTSLTSGLTAQISAVGATTFNGTNYYVASFTGGLSSFSADPNVIFGFFDISRPANIPSDLYTIRDVYAGEAASPFSALQIYIDIDDALNFKFMDPTDGTTVLLHITSGDVKVPRDGRQYYVMYIMDGANETGVFVVNGEAGSVITTNAMGGAGYFNLGAGSLDYIETIGGAGDGTNLFNGSIYRDVLIVNPSIDVSQWEDYLPYFVDNSTIPERVLSLGAGGSSIDAVDGFTGVYSGDVVSYRVGPDLGKNKYHGAPTGYLDFTAVGSVGRSAVPTYYEAHLWQALQTILPNIISLHKLNQNSSANSVSGAILDSLGDNHGTTAGMAIGDFSKTGMALDEYNTAIAFDGTDASIALANAEKFAFDCNDKFWVFGIVNVAATQPDNRADVFSKQDNVTGTQVGWGSFINTFYDLTDTNNNINLRPGFQVTNTAATKLATWTGYMLGKANTPSVFGQIGSPMVMAWNFSPSGGTLINADCKMWFNGVRLAVNITNTGAIASTDTMATSVSARIGSREPGVLFPLPFEGNLQYMVCGRGDLTNEMVRNAYAAVLGRLTKRSPPNVIVITDVEQDVDSYTGEVGCAIAAHVAGHINLLEVSIVDSKNGGKSAAAVSILANYLGYPGLKISQNFGSAPLWNDASNFTDDLKTQFPSGYTVDENNVLEATASLRSTLAAQEDGSVIIYAAGQATTMSDLINSTDTGDGHGDGKRLVHDKVQYCYFVAGGYEDSGSGYYHSAGIRVGYSTSEAEFNVYSGSSLTDFDDVSKNWPTPIVYGDYNFGVYSAIRGLSLFTDTSSPIRFAYVQTSHSEGRDTWGGNAIRHLIYDESGEAAGDSGKFFIRSAAGTNIVNTANNTPYSGHGANYNRFTPGASRNVSVSGIGTVSLQDQVLFDKRKGQQAMIAEMLLDGTQIPYTRPPTFYIKPSRNPAEELGAKLRDWLKPHDSAYRTIDTTTGVNTFSAMASVVSKTAPSNATKANQPLLVSSVVNGYDCAHFNATGKALTSARSLLSSSGGNLYGAMVLRVTDYATANFGRVWGLVNGSGADYNVAGSASGLLRDNVTSKLHSYNNGALGTSYADVAAGTTFYTVEVLFDDQNNLCKHWVNGVEKLSAAFSNTLSVNGLIFGSESRVSNIPSLGCMWPEFILAKNVTSGERAFIQDYLREKYDHY